MVLVILMRSRPTSKRLDGLEYELTLVEGRGGQ